jgi:hypothetical protein
MASVQEKTLDQFMNDPSAYFDQSITQMHMMDRDELASLQRAAMSVRFKQHYESIEMLRKLADRLKISELNEFDDVIPLFFAHTAFKSYPASLLDKKRFDMMTQWVNKMTSYDISHVDASACDSIDDWIELLDQETPLELITSSGTTGTISLIPKSKHSASYNLSLWKLFLFQRFGSEPSAEQLNPVVDVIWPNHEKGKLGHLRLGQMVKRALTGGDESKFHPLYKGAVDTDLLFLASKMRAAASKGELDRLVIDPKLLARKSDFEAMQERRPQEMAEFFEHITDTLSGKQVFMLGAWNLMFDVAEEGLKRGVKNVFAPNSVILTGGGLKGFTLPDNYREVIFEFLGVDRVQSAYGMSEVNSQNWACEENFYHINPWVIPFLLDPESGEPLPREGTQTGRAAFYDFLNESHWGGVISGDEITIEWSKPCKCGMNSVYIHDDIMRYSEKIGVEDDRISCSATQQVSDEAIDFMRGFEG